MLQNFTVEIGVHAFDDSNLGQEDIMWWNNAGTDSVSHTQKTPSTAATPCRQKY